MFINRICEHARANPGKLAAVSSGEEITYRRLAIAVDAARAHLIQAGLPEEGVLVNIIDDFLVHWAISLAARSLGLTAVSGASWQTMEPLGLRGIVAFACGPHQAGSSSAFRSAMPACPIITAFDEITNAPHDRPLPPPLPDGSFGGQILYTSGTTGSYKKVLFPGDKTEGFLEGDRYGLIGGHMTETDVVFAHNFGAWTAVGYKAPMRCWARGSTVIFDRRADWACHFYDYPVTMTSLVPGILGHVLEHLPSRPPGFPRLKIQVVGGFLDASLARRLAARLDCKVMITYGATEFRIAMANFVESDDDVVWLEPTFDPGVEIVDEGGTPVAIGVEGELRVALAPHESRSYIDDPEATARHFRDGWFYPGDMAVRRQDGRVRILGRMADVLNLAGLKIALDPFERDAREKLGVSELCAFNVQDEEGKDFLLLVVEGTRLPEREDVLRFAASLAALPRIRFSLIERFPRGDNGMMKINRRRLLELVRASWKGVGSGNGIS